LSSSRRTPYNRSQVQTVLVLVLTSNLRLAEAPGNVKLPSRQTGLPRDSVANVSQIFTLDRMFLNDYIGQLAPRWMCKVDDGLRRVLAL
jgi:mRNA interferase MazF